MEKDRLTPALRQRLLGAVVEFMWISGVSEPTIRDAFESGLQAIRARSSKGSFSREDGKFVGNGDVSAELLRIWHRDERYINKDAHPKPFHLSRGRPNVYSIIRKLDPDSNPATVVREMVAVGALRRLPSGKFIPTSESVTIAQLHPLAIEHVAKSVVRLVSTVCRNTDRQGSSLPLIEKYAYVPDLDRAAAREFAEFTRTQGMAYLEAVDDWLEKHRARRASTSARRKMQGVTAGVHLVAYLGDSADVSRSATAAMRRPSARLTSPREARA